MEEGAYARVALRVAVTATAEKGAGGRRPAGPALAAPATAGPAPRVAMAVLSGWKSRIKRFPAMAVLLS